MKSLISVIIPVYNVEEYLKKCIDSVRMQTYQNLQIILIDDGSLDKSSEICDEYAKVDNRILVIHKENGGLSSARNKGLQVATGDYITFLDSDDYVSSTVYEELYVTLQGRTDRIACTCFRRVDSDGKVYDRRDPHNIQGATSNVEYMRELLLHIGDTSVCTKMFPREILEGKFFDESKLNEDFLFMIEMIPDFKEIAYTGTVGYFYLTRQGSTSDGYGKAVEDMALNAIYVNEKIQREYIELREEGDRFALFQNMAYLLLVPKDLRKKNNLLYHGALQFLRNNFISKGIKNKYLGVKHKCIIFGLIIFPEFVIQAFQEKHRL